MGGDGGDASPPEFGEGGTPMHLSPPDFLIFSNGLVGRKFSIYAINVKYRHRSQITLSFFELIRSFQVRFVIKISWNNGGHCTAHFGFKSRSNFHHPSIMIYARNDVIFVFECLVRTDSEFYASAHIILCLKMLINTKFIYHITPHVIFNRQQQTTEGF